MKTVDLEQAQYLETIDRKPLKPWREPVFDKIDIENDREMAIQKVATLMNTPETVIFSDVSAKESNLGVAVVVLDQHNNVQKSQKISIGAAK
jgi:hypothetical protein